MNIIRKIMLVLGWLVAMAALVFAVVGLDLHWNSSAWLPFPELDTTALLQCLGIPVVLAAMWFLAKPTPDRVSQIGFRVCLVLAGITVAFVLPPERLTMERTIASPWWFRGGCTLLLCLPAAFWLWRLRPQADPSDQNRRPRWRGWKTFQAASGLLLLVFALWVFVSPDEAPPGGAGHL